MTSSAIMFVGFVGLLATYAFFEIASAIRALTIAVFSVRAYDRKTAQEMLDHIVGKKNDKQQ